MTEAHPVAATRLKKAIAKGAKLIVADPRRIRLAEMADLYLPIRVGSDVALLLGMAHVIAREGLVNEGFIQDRTAGADGFLDPHQALHPGMGRDDHRRSGQGHRAGRHLVRHGGAGGDLLHPGHHRAHLRGGQCAEPVQPGPDDRSHWPGGDGDQPHARARTTSRGPGTAARCPTTTWASARSPTRPTRPSSAVSMGGKWMRPRASPRSKPSSRPGTRSGPCSSTARTPWSRTRTALTPNTPSPAWTIWW